MSGKKNNASGSTRSPNKLSSLRGLRELSLGLGLGRAETKSRKTYVPNLNVRRNKNKEEVSVKEVHHSGDGRRGRGRGRGGRGRESANFIQEGGSIFAEGTALTQARRYGGGGYSDSGGSGSNYLPKPKLNLQHDRKVNKEEEELKLRELLRDDFVDDPALDPDSANKPIQLPFHASETSVQKALKPEIKASEEETIVDGVKIKQEPDDSKKSKTARRGEEDAEEEVEDPELNERTVGAFFKDVDYRIFFLQLPDTLPGLKPDVEPEPARPSTSKQSTGANGETPESSNQPNSSTNCNLDSLSDGYIGKIQLMKSGKARLILNDIIVDLASSLQTGYREDLISVNLDPATHTGEMINLGPVEARLLCSPDWCSMLPSHQD